MSTLQFPLGPSEGDTYDASSINGVIYTYTSGGWVGNSGDGLTDLFVNISGDTMTGNLSLPGGGGDVHALQKQEIQLLIDASGGGGTAPTDLFWERDTGALSPKVSTDNVDIGSGNITLNANGAADFKGNVIVGASNNIILNKAGAVSFSRPAESSGVGGKASLLQRLNFAGAATNTLAAYYAADDSQRYVIDSDGNHYIGTDLEGSDSNISLNADGTGTFASGKYTIASNGSLTIYNNLADKSENYSSLGNSGRLVLSRNDNTKAAIEITPSDLAPGVSTVYIYPDGSAVFSSNIKIGRYNSASTNVNGILAGSNGQLKLQRATGNGISFIIAYEGTAVKWEVDSSGSASFSNTLLNLEADDDTKYTATTNEEGEQTLVYNGAVLDVKERIQNVISRMDAIEANEVTDDATDSALLTLVASLSSRLDERDATIDALTTRITTLENQSNGGN